MVRREGVVLQAFIDGAQVLHSTLSQTSQKRQKSIAWAHFGHMVPRYSVSGRLSKTGFQRTCRNDSSSDSIGRPRLAGMSRLTRSVCRLIQSPIERKTCRGGGHRGIAQQNNFPSRQAPKPSSIPKRKQRRYRNGRNRHLGIKATAKTLERFYKAADDRNVPLGELLPGSAGRSGKRRGFGLMSRESS